MVELGISKASNCLSYQFYFKFVMNSNTIASYGHISITVFSFVIHIYLVLNAKQERSTM